MGLLESGFLLQPNEGYLTHIQSPVHPLKIKFCWPIVSGGCEGSGLQHVLSDLFVAFHVS